MNTPKPSQSQPIYPSFDHYGKGATLWHLFAAAALSGLVQRDNTDSLEDVEDAMLTADQMIAAIEKRENYGKDL